MNKTISYVGGIIAGFALSQATFDGTFLAGLTSVFDFLSDLSIAVFSLGLLWEGAKTLFNK